MNSYVASFFTHFAAQSSFRALKNAGAQARMAPVPRVLSSSCGTCVRYRADGPMRELLHRDTEALYLENETGDFTPLWKNER